MLHFRLIYDEILKSNVFASSRPGRTDARVILILALLLKYKRLRREMILFLIQHIDPCIQETGSMGQRTVKTCIERGWIKMQEQRGAREKGLYSITQAGKKHLYELINEYFQGETVQNMVSVLDAYAAGRTNMELSQHKEAEIAAALKMVLSDYREKWTQLEFEVPYSVEAMREYGGQAKKRGDVFADLKLSYRCTDHQEERPICIEIDMGTERVSTHGGLLFKCNAYAEVNRRMRQISLHQAINVMFVFSNDPADDLQQTDLLKFESIKRYQQPLLPFLSFICRQQDPDASVTLEKMEQALVKVKECDAFGYEKKQFYRDAGFFLHVLKEQCSNQEQAGEKEILACMTEISDFCRNDLETSRTEYSRQYALKKRMDLFEQIRKNNSYALAGLRNGMSLCCNSHQDFEKEIPYLFPELYFRDQFGVLLFHLGIIKESIKVSSVYALPLFEEQDLDGIGTVYRCVFMAGELTVLIENLSSDMGGLIRARDYVRLPLAVRENTIMIMLMNDREELADGSYLKEGTLYNQWGSEEHITDQAAIGMALLAKKVAPAMTAFGTGYAFESVPFLMNSTQDYIMLHYSEFLQALQRPVRPWIRMDLYVKEQNKVPYIPFLIYRTGEHQEEETYKVPFHKEKQYTPVDWRRLCND